MNLKKIKILFLVFLAVTLSYRTIAYSYDIHTSEPTFDTKVILEEVCNDFLAGNIEDVLDAFADNIVFIHQGPALARLPYGIYNGKEGFLDWAYKMSAEVLMLSIDMYYYVKEGYQVDAHVSETALFYNVGSECNIENHYNVQFNQEGKIIYFYIISESYTVAQTLRAEDGEVNSTQYKTSEIDSEYNLPEGYAKHVAIGAFMAIKDRQTGKVNSFFSKDAELVAGNQGITLFSGQYVGKSEIKKFAQIFSSEMITMDIQNVVAEQNKVDIIFYQEGIASSTGKFYSGLAVFAFQLDEKGKIARCYNYYDTYSAYYAYLQE